MSDVAILHTDSWSWTRPIISGSPPVARAGHSLVALSTTTKSADGDGEEECASLCLFGGRAAGDSALDDLYELRPLRC